ncbi:MAG: sterol desaturase family protein [Hyphomonadaceae bacterium]|nr:sterol desaturase family protein [Hyphomonadaceae bacterium]
MIGGLLVRAVIYPALMTAALVFLWAMLRNGAQVAWAPYVVVATIGLLIVLAERMLPHRREWGPGPRDFSEDAVYLVVVQMVLPLALGWTAAIGVLWLAEHAKLTLDVWPDHWPILAQLALKVISGDFLRYWLHRLAHTWPPLWRLHEVHHHPAKLYTTNVFRFHPLEKALQFLLDTAPFVFLGIGKEALAYYFVFYSVSGLFQHSNIDVRLGWLNYVVSGPEVHRWHHSRKIEESNNNYAHSFVVWDLVFGTYFRPKDRRVEALGLLDPQYPSGFFKQLSAPFRRGRDQNAS